MTYLFFFQYLAPSRIFISILIMLSVSGICFAQGYGSLRGNVVDSLNGEALPYANIILEGTERGATADLNGNFIIRGLTAGKTYTVNVSFLGYRTLTQEVKIDADRISVIRIQLSPINIQLQAIEKIGEKYNRPNETDLGLQQINIRDIELLPKGVETDIFRSLQFVPGVQNTGDVSARYYVRGGGSNQNLVLLNGVSVYNPFHAFGLFSIIDPEMINALEFYKGGFTADYGGRLSSILNLVTKDGNKNRFGTSATISFLTGKASVEGPIPEGSFIFTGRKSLFRDILRKFINYKNAPFDFYDFSGKINFLSQNTEDLTKISISTFNSLDQIKNEDPLKADYEWINNIYSAYWFQEWEDVPIYSETSASLSSFTGEIKPNESEAKQRYNKVKDVSFLADITYVSESSDEIKVGMSIKSIKTETKFENLQGTRTNLSDNGLHLNIYAKYKLLRWEDFGVDIGTRVNVLTLAKNKGSVLEPRVNLTFRPLPTIAVKAAWGIYTQDLITLVNDNEIITIFEPWLITPDYLRIPEAIHYVLGMEINQIDNLTISGEAYYKFLKNTAEMNENKASSSDPDFVAGKGEAYGIEMLMNYNRDIIQLTLSYSLSWSYKEVNDWIYYPKYDTRHSVTSNLNINLGNGWQTSLSWFFNSGLPFTQIEGFYDKLYFDDLFFSGGLYGYYLPFTVLADKNLGRLPTYHRLDLGLTKQFILAFTKISLSVNVLNVYNRKNIFYFERDTGARVNMLPFMPTATLKVEL
jgi:hypothetical protein